MIGETVKETKMRGGERNSVIKRGDKNIAVVKASLSVIHL